MPHTFNKTAFRSGARTNPLLSLYCSLVVLELGLKDARFSASAQWDSSHDVLLWITQLGDPALNSLAAQLSTALAKLQCTLRDGSAGPINPQLYPSLRYLRHETDFPGESTDLEIRAALNVVYDIDEELRKQGIV